MNQENNHSSNVISDELMHSVSVHGQGSHPALNTTLTVNPDIEIPVERVVNHNLTRLQAFWQIIGKGLTIAASFTFGIEVVSVIVMLSYLSIYTNAFCALASISALMNTVVTFGFSMLFAMGVPASARLGEVRTLQGVRQSLTDGDTVAETSLAEVRQILALGASPPTGDEDEDDETPADTITLERIDPRLQELRRRVANVFKNGALIAAIVVPPMMATLAFSERLLIALGQSANVAMYAQEFLRPFALAIPGIALRVLAEQLLFSLNQATPVMVMGLISLGLGTMLSLGLGFGAGMGFVGVAIGYVVEAYLTALGYSVYLGLHPEFSEYRFFRLFSDLRDNVKDLLALIGLGGFYLIAVSNEAIITFLTSVFAGALGTLEQEAWVFALQYIYFLFLVSAAFGMANCQELSRELGARCYDNARRVGIYGLLATLAVIVPLPVIFAIDPRILMVILGNQQPAIYHILRTMIPIVSVGVISDAVRYNLLQQLRPLQRSGLATFLSAAGLTLGIIIAGVLGLMTSLGIDGIALGYTLGSMIAALGLFIAWIPRMSPAAMAAMHAPAAPEVIELGLDGRPMSKLTTPASAASAQDADGAAPHATAEPAAELIITIDSNTDISRSTAVPQPPSRFGFSNPFNISLFTSSSRAAITPIPNDLTAQRDIAGSADAPTADDLTAQRDSASSADGSMNLA